MYNHFQTGQQWVPQSAAHWCLLWCVHYAASSHASSGHGSTTSVQGIQYKLKRCCKQCRQVKYKGAMTKWPVQNKHLEQHETHRTTRRKYSGERPRALWTLSCKPLSCWESDNLPHETQVLRASSWCGMAYCTLVQMPCCCIDTYKLSLSFEEISPDILLVVTIQDTCIKSKLLCN